MPAALAPGLGTLLARERSDVNPKSVQPFPIDNGLPGTQAALPIDCETPASRDGEGDGKGNSYAPISPLRPHAPSPTRMSLKVKDKDIRSRSVQLQEHSSTSQFTSVGLQLVQSLQIK